MPRIVTGQISYASAVRDTTDETYTHGNRAYFGSEGGNAGIDNMYVLLFTPVAGELQDVASNEISALRIRLKLKKKTTNAPESEFIYKIYGEEQSWYSPKSLYNIVDGGVSYTYAWVDFANTLEEQEIVISLTGTAAYYAAQFGFSLANLTLGDIVEVTSYSMEADVSDAKVPPVISLTNGFGQVVDGKYWHYPENEFTLIVNYSQDVGEPIYRLDLYFTDQSGYQRHYQGEAGSTSVTVPDNIWERLPCYGTIKMEAWTAGGVYSNTIEMPFEVGMYDVVYMSHTSGSVIPSDEDVSITWAPSRPTGLPAAVNMKPPTGYTWYIWWDDAERTSGTNTADTSCTVSASMLAKHSVLHIAVAEKYGNYGSRDVDYAPVMNLYIQQVAGIGGVSVGDKWYNDVWFPGVTVSWESVGQTAFQVRVGDVHDSGPVWGTAKSYKVPLILNDGVYPVTVRVQDSNGVWGAWTSPVWITVKDLSEATHNTITARKTAEGVEITVTITDRTLESYSSILLYRDGVMIAQAAPADTWTYLDRAAVGTCMYWARIVSAASTAYDTTATITLDATPDTDGLNLQDGTWLPLRYTEAFPRRYPSSSGEEVYARYYAGREYPVYMRSGRKDESITMTYTDKGNALADRMEELAGECVLYKTTSGNRIYGILERVQAERGRMRCAVTFTLRRADFEDAVPYRWPEE